MTSHEIKAARAALGLTQDQLAKELAVSAASVQAWEAGRRRPRGSAIKLLKGMLLPVGEIKPGR